MRTRLLLAAAVLALTLPAAGCALIPGAPHSEALTLGETAQDPPAPADAVVTMTLLEARAGGECPSRAGPDSTLTGDILILTVHARVAPGAEEVVNTSPERFRATDSRGEPAGGFSPVLWECFDDADLLPMLLSAGEEGSGYVVIEARPSAATVEFDLTDDVTFQWHLPAGT